VKGRDPEEARATIDGALKGYRESGKGAALREGLKKRSP
jgi:hypothetical protein